MTQAFNLSQLANFVNSSGQLNGLTGVVNAVPSATTTTNITGGTKGQVPVQSAAGATTFIDSSFALKNRIINGAMVIDQRNAGASVSNTSASLYGLDRWNLGGLTGCTFTGQQVADAPAGFIYSNKITITSTTTANDYGLIRQIIEAFNVLDLGWGTTNAQPITVSFWVKVNNAGTYNAALRYIGGTATYYYVHPYTLTANTWTYVSFTVSGAPTGAGAFTAGNNTGYMDLDVLTLISSGYTGTATADTWSSTSAWKTSGTFNFASTASATFQFTGVQLEKGSTATSFDYRPYGTELALCQRYYYVSSTDNSGGGGGAQFVGAPISGALTIAVGQGRFPVTMRTAPTVTLPSGCGQSGLVADSTSTAGQIGTDAFVRATIASGSWANSYTPVQGRFTASAEL